MCRSLGADPVQFCDSDGGLLGELQLLESPVYWENFSFGKDLGLEESDKKKKNNNKKGENKRAEAGPQKPAAGSVHCACPTVQPLSGPEADHEQGHGWSKGRKVSLLAVAGVVQ